MFRIKWAKHNTMKKAVLILLAMVAAFTYVSAQSASGFSYYKTITIDHTKVSGSSNLTDFPVLISVTDNALRTTANGGRLQNANGWDILFTNSTGSTDLNFQIESYTATNGNLVAWVRVPTVAHNTNTVIRIYYGKSGVGANPSSNSTWTSDYVGVWHFDNNVNDATGNGRNGTNTGSTNTTGRIASGRSFNGTNQYVTVAHHSSLNINTGTFSAWIEPSTVTGGFRSVIGKQFGTGHSDSYFVGINNNRVYTSTTSCDVTGSTNLVTSTWYHLAVVQNGSNRTIYLNGVSNGTSGACTSNNNDVNPVLFGAQENGTPGISEFFGGKIDEIKISNVAKSADWIATEYNNQNNPASFYTVGAEQAITKSTYDLDITANMDTEIWTSKKDDNYGTCNKIYINRSPQQRGLIQFDLSAIPNNAEITSASLRLQKIGGKNGSHNLSVHRITSAWTEGTGGCSDGTKGNATWNRRTTNTAWTTAGGDFENTAAATIAVSSNGTYTWGITNLVQNWVNGTNPNYGALLKFTTESGGDEEKDFATREHSTVANRPRLILSYTIPVTATVNVVDVSCFGGNNGSLTANVIGGVTPYTYAWSGGGNNATKSGVTAGTYTVTVTDAVGATTTAQAQVEQPTEALSGSILVNQHETCNGCANGNITASATGGSPAYSYNWGGGNENATRSNLVAGSYTVTITDEAGCTATATTTVNQEDDEPESGGGLLSGYEFRKPIIIDNTKVCGSSAHNNFPILVSVTDTDLRTLANGGKVLNASGFDIRFTDSDGTTLLDHQIEKYTASSGLFVAWVRIPSLPHNADKTIYMYFGKTGVTTNPSSTNVWSNGFNAVWHFNNSINDFSGNSNNGSNTGTTNNNSGKIAEARSFNGSNQFISVANSSSLNISGNTITMSAWVQAPQNSQDAPFVVKGTTMNEEQYMLGIQNGANRFVNRRVTTSGGHFRYDVNTLPNNTWAYVVTVYDGAKASNPRLFTYVNGSLVASENANGNINSTTGGVNIGKRLGTDNRYFQGSLDELRIASVARSTDWICTEYNNQNSPSTFYSVGVLEPLVPAGTIIWRGTIDKHWSKAGNWSTNTVPTATDSAYVPYGTPNTLELNGSGNYNVNHIHFDNMATLSSASGATLNIKGNLHVGGCGFNVNNGHIKFNGNVAQYIYSPCRTQFYRLYIENTSSTGVYMSGASVQVNHELFLRDGYLYTNGDTVVVARNSANNSIKEYNEDESHVVGYLTRFLNKNKDTYAFPVGKGAADASYLISIKNNDMQGLSRLTVIFRDLDEDPQVIQSMLANANIEEDGVVYRRLCEEGMWTIEPNIQPTAGSYNVIADLKNFKSATSVEVGILKKPTGSPTANWGLGNGQRNNNIVGNLGQAISQIMRNSKAQRNGLTSFSDFGVGDEGSGSGLPIELLTFTGEMNTKTKAVDLRWSTATEINNEKFLIQRSLDGEIFEDLGEMAGAGNSNSLLNYKFSDTKPVKGIAYYRLKQVDFDGKYAYSDLISITNNSVSIVATDVEVKVYPNPSDGLIKISADTDEAEIHVHVISANGAIIKSITATNEASKLFIEMNLKEFLPAGNYFIKVSGQSFTSLKKFQVVKN